MRLIRDASHLLLDLILVELINVFNGLVFRDLVEVHEQLELVIVVDGLAIDLKEEVDNFSMKNLSILSVADQPEFHIVLVQKRFFQPVFQSDVEAF